MLGQEVHRQHDPHVWGVLPEGRAAAGGLVSLGGPRGDGELLLPPHPGHHRPGCVQLPLRLPDP